MAFFKILPEEITLDIISRLPDESILHCKLVCTTWNNLLRHPSLSKIQDLHHLIHPSDSAVDSGKLGFLALILNTDHLWYFEYNENLDRSTPPLDRITRVKLTLPFDKVELLGSCNGLIFLSRESHQEAAPLCICNAITREYVLLPEIKRDWDYDWIDYWTSGFGYISSTNEYKVVRMKLENSLYHVYIYRLGSGNGWKNLGIFSLGSSKYCYDRAASFANGALHWVDRRRDMIVAFDLAEEKFCEHLSLPPLPLYSIYINNHIGVLDGFLYFAMYLYVENNIHYDIWLLKKKNDNHDMKEGEERQSLVWSKEFRVRERKLLSFTETNGLLTYNPSYLNIYDTKASTSKRLVGHGECFSEIFPHKNTLVSLKELEKENTKTMELAEVKETGKMPSDFQPGAGGLDGAA